MCGIFAAHVSSTHVATKPVPLLPLAVGLSEPHGLCLVTPASEWRDTGITGLTVSWLCGLCALPDLRLSPRLCKVGVLRTFLWTWTPFRLPKLQVTEAQFAVPGMEELQAYVARRPGMRLGPSSGGGAVSSLSSASLCLAFSSHVVARWALTASNSYLTNLATQPKGHFFPVEKLEKSHGGL